MTTLRTAAQQALEALEAMNPYPASKEDQRAGALTALRAALAQQDEPVARECSDPMCACRGGPCAECEEGEREKEIEDLRSSLYFYQRRCEALQSWQSKMRDPERTIVCDILANGKTLDPAVAGNRYTTPQQAEPAQEQAEPLTIERLRDALVASRIIPPAAVEDPDEYDDGVTLHRIEALHRRIT